MYVLFLSKVVNFQVELYMYVEPVATIYFVYVWRTDAGETRTSRVYANETSSVGFTDFISFS